MGQRKTVLIGVGMVAVGVLCFTTPAAGVCIIAGLIVWIFSVMKNPTGSYFVARLSGTPTPTKSQHLFGVTVAMGAILGVAVVSIAGAKTDAARTERHAAELRAYEQRKVDDEDAALRRTAPAALAQLSAVMTSAAAALDARDEFAAQNSVNQGKALVTKYDKLSPAIPEMTVFSQQIQGFDGQLSVIANVKNALDGAALREAQADIKDDDYVAAAKVYDDLLSKLDVPAETAKYVSMSDVKKMRATVESKRRAIARPLQRQQLREGAAQLYQKVCGEKPLRSGWSGAIVGLEDHIKESANDPDSIDVKECTVPIMTEKHCWISTCKVRGKNGFGALILRVPTYSFSTLGIEEVSER